MHTRITSERKRNKFTQVGMARAIGVARQTYLDMESGKTEPKVSTAIELSNIFRCNLMWLITGESQDNRILIKNILQEMAEIQVKLNKL